MIQPHTATLEAPALPAELAGMLDRIRTDWLASRAASRDAKLQTGKALLAYLLACRRHADSLPEARRGPYARQMLLADIARALNLSCPTVNELIRTAAAVEALSAGGDVGSLSYTSLRWFRLAIERRRGPVRRREDWRAGAIQDGLLAPSQREEWTVRDERFIGLFRRAVAESWGSDRVREELRGKTKTMPTAYRFADEDVEERRSEVQLRRAVASASPRDAAELLLDVVCSSSAPLAVAEHLLRLVRLRPQELSFDEEE